MSTHRSRQGDESTLGQWPQSKVIEHTNRQGLGCGDLLAEVRSCRACEAHLPLGPRPVLQVGASARILFVGQAPGVRVHNSGVPWDDPSGDSPRAWTGLDKKRFYDASDVAIIPMGFLLPGAGSGRFQRNPWFEHDLLPSLKQRVASLGRGGA